MNDIRYLIENYYDIQKIRVETFNRIVSFVKENKDKVMEMIKNLSHYPLEPQNGYASHPVFESQRNDASQYKDGNQPVFASQVTSETQRINASQITNENQKSNAVSLLKDSKYSDFVKKFVITKKIGIKEVENLVWFHNKLFETEKELYKILDGWSREHPLRVNFLNYVKGIGPVLASALIAWLSEPILKAEHVSNLWSYCGLKPNSERKRGEKLGYNPKLKSLCWKIGESFIKKKCFGRKLYDTFKEETQKKHPDWTKLHIHNYARRKVVKLFLASLWEVWRKMNNISTTEPYPVQYLGHSKIVPDLWIEKRGDL
mgnify:CR=1 FL=1